MLLATQKEAERTHKLRSAFERKQPAGGGRSQRRAQRRQQGAGGAPSPGASGKGIHCANDQVFNMITSNSILSKGCSQLQLRHVPLRRLHRGAARCAALLPAQPHTLLHTARCRLTKCCLRQSCVEAIYSSRAGWAQNKSAHKLIKAIAAAAQAELSLRPPSPRAHMRQPHTLELHAWLHRRELHQVHPAGKYGQQHKW